MRTLKSLTGLWAVTLAAACGAADRGAPEAVVRDSAGVRIVENAGPRWPDADGWRLSAEPEVNIGALEGDEPYLLANVRYGLKRSDGTIVIANGATAELRFYDVDGRFIGAAGGEGGGPGEFSSGFSMYLLAWAGDSVGVWDFQARRMTIFDPAGAMAREIKLVLEERTFPQPLGFLGHGELALTDYVGFTPPGPPGTMTADSMRYSSYSLTDSTFTEIRRLPRGLRYSAQWQGRASIFPLPFGPAAQEAVSNGRLYFTDAVRAEFWALDDDGVVRQIVRQPGEPKPLTQDIIDALIERRMADAPEEPEGRQAWRDWFRDVPWPENLPAYQDMQADRLGNLWVMAYRPDTEDPGEWFVFDTGGQWLSTIVFPPRFDPLDIGADYVLGRWQDELDVEYVRVYGLVKPVEVTAR